MHAVGEPASAAALEASGIDADERGLWARWDGMDLAAGEARVLMLAQISASLSYMKNVSAFRACGRLNVTSPTAPRTS